MKTCHKRILSLLFVAVLCVSLSGSAFAELASITRAKAGIASLLLAWNLVTEPVNASFENARANSIDPIGSVARINENAWTAYLDQSVLQVKKDVVTVDGVQYSDILLGPDATKSLRLSGLDFISAYNILADQSEAVTYAEGIGSIDGYPIYNINGIKRSVYYHFLYGSEGDVPGWTLTFQPSSTSGIGYVYFSGLTSGSRSVLSSEFPRDYYTEIGYGNAISLKFIKPTGSIGTLTAGGTFVEDPFSFDYTSGVIDVPIADDDWLQIRVPTSYTDPSTGTGYDINDVLTDYPQLTDGKDINIDPSLNPDFQTDIDIGDTIGDLINTILNLLDLLPDGVEFNITKNEQPEPEPEPAPIPDPEDIPDIRPEPVDPEEPETIAETNWNFLSNLLRWIQSTIDNFRVATSNALYNIDKILNEIHDTLVELPDYLRRFFDPDWWNKWLDAKEKHAIDTIKKGIEALKRILLPIFLSLKNAIGIWHYVVEWLSAIGTPFAWIMARFSSMGGNAMLPIYASIAGFIVIAVYKRFGR